MVPVTFYKMSPLVGACIINSVEFGVYNESKEWLQSKSQPGEMPLYKIGMAGAISGMVGNFVTTPTEYLKCNLQVEATASPSTKYLKFTGPVDMMRHLYRHLHTQQPLGESKGVFKQFWTIVQFYKMLNRGFAITALRESGLALYFGSYEATIRLLQYYHKKYSPIRDEDSLNCQVKHWTEFCPIVWSEMLKIFLRYHQD